MTYFPIVFVLSNSLKSGKNIFSSGVFSLFTEFDTQNYATVWSGVSRQLGNTIAVAALTIVIGVTAAALGAYAFSQLRFRGKGLPFMAYIALLLIPWTLTLIPLPYAASAQPLLVLIFRGFVSGSRQAPRPRTPSACTPPANFAPPPRGASWRRSRPQTGT